MLRVAICLAYSLSSVIRPRRSLLAKPRLPHTTRFLDGITPGPRTVPASLPTRSTRLAVLRRRRRCESGMGSRSRTNEMTALAESAERQSLWSSTSDVLKRRVEIARWVTFAFFILGALLAAIASQLSDPPRMYCALAGAILLAVNSSDLIYDWHTLTVRF